MADTRHSLQTSRRLLVAIVLVAVLLAVGSFIPMDRLVKDMVDWFNQLGAVAYGLFFLAYFFAGLLLLPIFPLTTLAGMIFGLSGVCIVLPAAALSATLAGWLGQTILEKSVMEYLEERPVWKAVCQALSGHGIRAVILSRLSPILPFGVQNYGLGAVGVGPQAHFWGTLIGIQPAMWAGLYIGHMVTDWAQAQAKIGATNFGGPRAYVLGIGILAVLGLLTWLGRVALNAQKNLV